MSPSFHMFTSSGNCTLHQLLSPTPIGSISKSLYTDPQSLFWFKPLLISWTCLVCTHLSFHHQHGSQLVPGHKPFPSLCIQAIMRGGRPASLHTTTKKLLHLLEPQFPNGFQFMSVVLSLTRNSRAHFEFTNWIPIVFFISEEAWVGCRCGERCQKCCSKTFPSWEVGFPFSLQKH